MKYTKKFVLVPIDRYEDMQKKLQQQFLISEDMKVDTKQVGLGEEQKRPPGIQPLKDLGRLTTEETKNTDQDQITTEQITTPSTNSINSTETYMNIEDIARTLGKPYRHKAKEILKLIQRIGPHIFTWTNTGEIVYKGQIIKGSNIIDLMRSIMYKTSKISNLLGSVEFEEILKEMNVPLSLIGNVESRGKLINQRGTQYCVISKRKKVMGAHAKKKKWISL